MRKGFVADRETSALAALAVAVVATAAVIGYGLFPKRYTTEWGYLPNSSITSEAILTSLSNTTFPDEMQILHVDYGFGNALLRDAIARGAASVCLDAYYGDYTLSFPGLPDVWVETAGNLWPFPGGVQCLRYRREDGTATRTVDGVPSDGPWQYDPSKDTPIFYTPMETAQKTVIFHPELAYFLYPFDSITLVTSLGVKATLYDERGKVLDTDTYEAGQLLDAHIPGWVITSRTNGPPEARITIARPWPLKASALALLFALLLAPPAVLLLDSIASASQIAFAALLGAWVARQALHPTVPPGIVAMDVLLFLYYILIIIAVLLAGIRALPPRAATGEAVFSLPGSYVYHVETCRHIRATGRDSLASFPTSARARDTGLRPCRTCIQTRETDDLRPSARDNRISAA